MRRALLIAWLLACGERAAFAQASGPVDGPFDPGRWHAEFATQAALEAWNYNISHEQLYGLSEGVTYGLKKGLVLTATQRIYYVSQQANDAWVLSVTGGLRRRLYQRGRLSVFGEVALGISDTAIATPPRGTRFNYLAIGSAGTLVRLRPRVYLLAQLQVTHVSNASLKGPSRNPDIEAVGVGTGLLLALR
jgi:hypothetical protein